MDENYKRSTRSAHHRQLNKVRSREEQREIRERSRGREHQKESNRRSRRREWDGNSEEDAGFERMLGSRDRPPLDAGRPSPKASQEAPSGVPAGALRALVTSVARGRAQVRVEGSTYDLALNRELAEAQQGAIAVGDEAWVELEDESPVRVGGVLPRRSAVSRPHPADRGRERVLAANVDLGVICVTPRRSVVKLGLIDRFLVALQRGEVGALICVNKIDLVEDPAERAALMASLAPYRELGLRALPVSAHTGEGTAELHALLSGRTCVFVGQSGVGKSSLSNVLDPSGERLVMKIRDADGRGRHTTSASSLAELECGTRLIDTPGIRSFGLW